MAQGSDKYGNVRIGLSNRPDTQQAAIRIEMLRLVPEEIPASRQVAERYAEALHDIGESSLMIARRLPKRATGHCGLYDRTLGASSRLHPVCSASIRSESGFQ